MVAVKAIMGLVRLLSFVLFVYWTVRMARSWLRISIETRHIPYDRFVHQRPPPRGRVYNAYEGSTGYSNPPAPVSPYAILGVAAGAAWPDIKRAYQDKIRQYHPDQVAHMAEEFQDLAEKRTKEINEAYNQLKRANRGV